MRLQVWIEKEGCNLFVGTIQGEASSDAIFSYDATYLSHPDAAPISLSLPLQEVNFSPEQTQCFFDGLLPEGYTRRCVAEELQVDTQDYLHLLASLGRECLGAIQILEDTADTPQRSYQKMNDDALAQFAKEGALETAQLVVKSHLSLTGASGKTGLALDEAKGIWYLPLGSAPSTHILKQSHVRLRHIVANEQLSLLTAKKLGIDVPESFTLSYDGQLLFATKRYDRKLPTSGTNKGEMAFPLRLHQEDFAQALGIPAAGKYEKAGDHYLLLMFQLLRQHSANPVADQLRLWDLCVFNYLLGNTDNHIKNVSLLYSPDLRSLRLAPAYDILCTQTYESSTSDMALSIGGVYDIHQVTRGHFEKEAKAIGLAPAMALARFDALRDGFASALLEAAEELSRDGLTQATQLSKEILECFHSMLK